MEKISFRMRFAIFLLKASDRFERFLPLFLTPEALIQLNQWYFKKYSQGWIELASEGLFDHEKELLKQFAIKPSQALCLGAGGGREVFGLVDLGFEVVGIEQVPELVHAAKSYAAKNNLKATFYCQDMSQIKFTNASFDAVFLLNNVYSYIPSKKLRMQLLDKLYQTLKPGGCAILSFDARPPEVWEIKRGSIFSCIAWLLGNPEYEVGNRVSDSGVFTHHFNSPEVIKQEAEDRRAWARKELFTNESTSYLVLVKDLRSTILDSETSASLKSSKPVF